ncbi:Ferric reductase like transmembrane component [Pleurostoma richardsiae]|uniref:Ferric reductase like transmembrane component n=1 Tax=Pleurostoma richardsiae TaxID=41990 RepID=A0AA38VSC9_9PEZI|nr:Ferric reductase like transmembrane component [Pleurostoma richardsiae]
MRRPLLLTLLLLTLLSLWGRGARAAGSQSGEMCFAGCQMALRPPHFNDTGRDLGKLSQSCVSRLHIASLYLCIDVYCQGGHESEGLARLNETCTKYVKSPLPPFDVIANYTADDIAHLRRLEREEVDDTIILNEVVVPSERLFRLSYGTLDAWAYVYGLHLSYGGALFIFWGVVVLVGISTRILSAIGAARQGGYQPLISSEQDVDEEVSAYKGVGHVKRPHMWLKRYITVPATFGYRCAQNVGWCTIPPRIQSLTILAFILLNVFFCVHGYRVFRGNMYWPDLSGQIWRYVSDRTGIVSFANFPILWLFGMRNNLLLWLTGWDFGTYNNFHRWVARVATLQAVVHSVGYTVLVLQNGGWPYFVGYWSQLYWWTGEVATILMCLLLGLSVFWMRRKVYEAFLILHIVLSVVILFAMLGHVSIFKGRFDGIIWASVFIWGLDRVLRVSRVLAFNPKFWATRAKATYNPDSNIIRLLVPYSTSLYQPKAGTFYYLHVLNDRRFWESHPFTVASVTPRHDAPAKQTEERGPTRSDEVSLLLQGGPESAVDTPAVQAPAHSTMTFLLRPYDSFTARLRDTAAASWPGAVSLRVLVDGPYGHTQRLDRFDSVLFVVGGSGIVVPLSYLELLPRSRPARIVWAARERELAADVARLDLAGALGAGRLALDVYITKDEAAVAEAEAGDGGWAGQGVRVLPGRPDVRAEVECAARAAGGGSLAVVACGPARMADDARRAVVDVLGRWGSNIEYFEESFGW